MTELTYDRAVELLRECVADKGEDFVYNPPTGRPNETSVVDCQYVHHQGEDGKPVPGCIVGHVIFKLEGEDGLYRIADKEGEGAPDVMHALGYDLDDDTERLLCRAQEAQDMGTPWGEAVRGSIDDPEWNA